MLSLSYAHIVNLIFVVSCIRSLCTDFRRIISSTDSKFGYGSDKTCRLGTRSGDFAGLDVRTIDAGYSGLQRAGNEKRVDSHKSFIYSRRDHRSYFGQSFRLDDLRGPYRIAERTRRMCSGNFIMLYTIQR